jgi:integrase
MKKGDPFTDKGIRGLKAKEKPYVLSDDGLYIRVLPTGRKVWMHVYSVDGKRRWYKLGVYPDLSLADARVKLRKVKGTLDDGKDPAEEKQRLAQERRAALTVEELCQEYLEKWAKPRKKSWKEDKRCLDKDVIPLWGKRKARDITKRDVILLLESIVERGAPVQANNTLEKVRKMFNFAVERDIIQHSPCQGVRPLTKKVHKDRNLSADEINTFWSSLSGCPMSDKIRCALKLILVTAQRPGEVIGLHTSEIDGQWWTIPAERSKNGKAHRVYLSPLALELIGDRKGYVFESPKGGKAMDVNALAFALRRSFKPDEKTEKAALNLEHFTPHDLRRTAASHMASLGFGVVVEKVLNHTNRTVTAIYDRYDYDAEKKRALLAWERRLKEIITGEESTKVVQMFDR